MTPESVSAHLRTLILGRRIEMHPQVGSTNDLVREAARRGEPEGLVILAEEQVAGRGRLGRVWTAPPGCCILCSVLFRPRFPAEYAFYLTIAASLAIYRVVGSQWSVVSGQRSDPNSKLKTMPSSKAKGQNSKLPTPNTQHPTPTLKWPNDVLIGGRKVAGVLSESEFSGGEWRFAVVGFGINVNLSPAELGELQGVATSLSAELERSVDRAALLARVLEELESLYMLLQNGQFGLVQSQWVGALETIGKRVSVRETSGTVTGRAVRVDPDGALVVREDSGAEKRVLAGVVVARPPTDHR